MCRAKRGDRGFGKRPRLVESALCLLRPVQGNRNHEHAIRRVIRKPRHGFGKHVAERSSGCPQTIVFECMNCCPHSAFIRPAGNSTNKGRGRQLARPAKNRSGLAAGLSVCLRRIPTTSTAGPVLDRKLAPARITDWNGRKVRQVGAAKNTGGRKEDATDGIHGTSEYASYRAPAGSLRWWTECQRTEVYAEDAPHLQLARCLTWLPHLLYLYL